MCIMNGSASAPSSATMKGTRCAIKPEMKATSRDRRHSFATTTASLGLASLRQRRGKLRPALQGVAALAGFDLHKFSDHLAALRGGKPGDGFALGFDAQAALALLACRNPKVADNLPHGARSPPLSKHLRKQSLEKFGIVHGMSW